MSASETAAATQVPAEIRLPEGEARAALLVRAFEESDPEALVLARAERRRATDAAGDEPDFARRLARRSEALAALLGREVAPVPRLLRVSSLRLAAAWIVLPAFLFGVGANLLGPEQRVNVVANALGGLILWNLLIYAVIAVGALRHGRRALVRSSAPREADAPRAAEPTVSLATALAAWPTRIRARAESRRAGERAGSVRGVVVAAGIARFLEAWNRCAVPLLAARLKRALHLGAAAMVLGALGGMYVRGLLFEYRATWESTFLGARQVQGWLDTLLGPAAALTGIPVPSVASIESPESGDAAAWIHLYAVATLMVVIVPRGLLTFGASLRARRLAAALPLDTSSAYYRALFRRGGGSDVRAEVIPFSYTLSAPRADALKALLHDALGGRARIDVRAPLEYGAGIDAQPDEARSGERWRVALFNLAQTPESEVHGRLLEDLKRTMAEGDRCLVLVDASAWRERAGDAPTFERRLAEHRRTWGRIVRDAELDPVHVDLDEPSSERLLDEIERASWPRSARGVAG